MQQNQKRLSQREQKLKKRSDFIKMKTAKWGKVELSLDIPLMFHFVKLDIACFDLHNQIS